MVVRSSGTHILVSRFFLLLLSLACFSGSAAAQTSSGTLRGMVTDPSGAAVPQAKVTVTGPGGEKSATSNREGSYEIGGLAAGKYAVKAAAKGFATFESPDVEIPAGQVRKLDVPLALEVVEEKVEVQDQNSTQIDVAPSENASALIIKGQDLEALSDDPDELQAELQALAGPGAGPNGGQIYIDGFTGGQLPPKSSIREIRINQNPFSAEFDKLGYGRIEIFTKPGTDQFHGQVFVNDTGSFLNSKNPLVPADVQPDYQTQMFNGVISGPINKHASFFVNAERRNINDNNIVDAQSIGVQQGVGNPRRRTNVSPRLDYQVSPNNTLSVRYQFTQDDHGSDGVGGLNLASQAYNVTNREQTLQISDTQIVSPRTINETRFQYIRDRNNQDPLDFSPTINVLGAFVGGGNNQGIFASHSDHFELQNYTSMALGKHMLKFGGRLREVRDAQDSYGNFNGMFIFPSLEAFNGTSCPTPQPCPSQFSIVTGKPLAKLSLFDAGLFTQDDWRIRPNMTLSLGLRFETQTQINDHADLAPRLGFAWGLGHGKTPPKTVLRAGFGIFYDRFADNLLLQAEQLNGINQQTYIVNSPTFYPTVPPLSSLSSLGVTPIPTRYQVDSRLHAPYVIQSAVAVERQVTKKATVALTYLNSRGFDQLVLRNANAPVPGTAGSTVQPLGAAAGNIYVYESEAVFRQNQLIANFRVNAGSRLSLFGFYSLSYANGDTGAMLSSGGATSSMFMVGTPATVNFLSNSYNINADYGRTAFDIRHRFAMGGTIGLPYAFRLSPFVLATSGRPFNITAGEDLNNDSIFNDRPYFANADHCDNDVSCFSTTPTGQPVVPINYGTGPAQVTFNLRLAKTIGLGKKVGTTAAAGGPGGPGGPGGGGGRGGRGGGPGGGLGPRGLTGGGGGSPFGLGGATDRRYSLTFSIAARNLLNTENLAPPVGVISSPLSFGHSVALAGGPFGTTSANRRIDLQMMFTF
jgi:hypothetical protein